LKEYLLDVMRLLPKLVFDDCSILLEAWGILGGKDAFKI